MPFHPYHIFSSPKTAIAHNHYPKRNLEIAIAHNFNCDSREIAIAHILYPKHNLKTAIAHNSRILEIKTRIAHKLQLPSYKTAIAHNAIPKYVGATFMCA